jgi:hypothetical protein|tara:strand:- start:53 stop:223 length:171 start_codon:yes stop_codon:yes gene_type:complete
MPKACVMKKMKAGMSKKQAIDACYPKAGKMTKAGLKMGLIKTKKKPVKSMKKGMSY